MRRASMAGVTAPAWSLPSRSRTTCWDQGDGTEVCWPVPGPTFFHDTQARQKDRVRWPTRVVKPAMCSTVQLRILDRGRDEGATRPSPMLCRNPLSIIVSCCGDWLTRRTGSGRAIRGRQQGWEVAESQALRLHQAREQRQGFVGRAGWLEWLNEWYGPMLCQVQISHSSSMRCAMSPHACVPQISDGRP